MKTIQRTLLLSLVPLLTPLTAYADHHEGHTLNTPVPGTKGKADSWRASQVMGLNVKNAGDETIGEVKDLVLDLKSGDVLAVVISSGGFLGMADTLSAVPVSVLRYDANTKAFKTKLTKEQLGKAPNFKSTAWPDYNDAVNTDALRSYRDSIGGDVTAPDNTAQNEKAKNKDVMIPTDQGSSEKDVQITKDIRSGIMATDLSFNAKNIKIITKDQYVVLKGVVDNHAEHESILKIARNHANSAKITDELEMKSK
ncbi:MAG: PRC-barrel domain-containing protein [Verrucomicrobiota bacterium]